MQCSVWKRIVLQDRFDVGGVCSSERSHSVPMLAARRGAFESRARRNEISAQSRRSSNGSWACARHRICFSWHLAVCSRLISGGQFNSLSSFSPSLPNQHSLPRPFNPVVTTFVTALATHFKSPWHRLSSNWNTLFFCSDRPHTTHDTLFLLSICQFSTLFSN